MTREDRTRISPTALHHSTQPKVRSWRHRCRAFLARERRQFARLIGAPEGRRVCRRSPEEPYI